MDKFSVNFGALEDKLRPQAPVFKYEDVKHRLRKVAFDIVRFVDTDNIDGLWQIQQTDDGDVIVAMYSDQSPEAEKTASAWAAVPDNYGSVNLFYKNDPVTKVSLAKLGMADATPDTVCAVLMERLATNEKLLHGLLASLSSEERKDLLSTHPELVSQGQQRMGRIVDMVANKPVTDWMPWEKAHEVLALEYMIKDPTRYEIEEQKEQL